MGKDKKVKAVGNGGYAPVGSLDEELSETLSEDSVQETVGNQFVQQTVKETQIGLGETIDLGEDKSETLSITQDSDEQEQVVPQNQPVVGETTLGGTIDLDLGEEKSESVSITSESEKKQEVVAPTKVEPPKQEQHAWKDDEILKEARKEYKEHLREEQAKLEEGIEVVTSGGGYEVANLEEDKDKEKSESRSKSISTRTFNRRALDHYKAKRSEKHRMKVEAENTRTGNLGKHGERTGPNSLMGWSKGEDGSWTQTGSAPEVVPMPKSLKDDYWTEQKNSAFRGSGGQWTQFLDDKSNGKEVKGTNTRYLTEEEQQKVSVGVSTEKEGTLVDSKGEPVDTTKSSGTGTFQNTGAGRYIFAKGDDGKIRTIDPWEYHQESSVKEWEEKTGFRGLSESGMAPNDTDVQLSFANHSSLVAGGNVRGAGELVVEKGVVKVVTDQSGHYHPDNAMTYDVVQGLVEQGVKPEGMSVGLVKKDRPKEDKTSGIAHGDLYAGALEFLSYGGAKDAEEKMRQARKGREEMGLFDMIKNFDKTKLESKGTNDKSNPILVAEGEEVDKKKVEQVRETVKEVAKQEAPPKEKTRIQKLIEFYESKPLK